MPGEQREADDQEQQVDHQDPLAGEMRAEAGRSRRAAKRREDELVDRDDAQADQGDAQRMAVQHRDAGEDGGEEDEFDRDAGDGGDGGVHAFGEESDARLDSKRAERESGEAEGDKRPRGCRAALVLRAFVRGGRFARVRARWRQRRARSGPPAGPNHVRA